MMLCCTLQDGGPDCLPEVPVNQGQEGDGPKAGITCFQLETALLMPLAANHLHEKPFFFSFCWIGFLGIVKTGLRREFKSFTPVLGVLICHENKGAELQWWMSGQLERSLSDRSMSGTGLKPQKQK